MQNTRDVFKRASSVVLMLGVVYLSAGCMTLPPLPSMAVAPPTLKGCELGPSNELLADLSLGKSYLAKGVSASLQPKLQGQVSDLEQRLAKMEEVRKKSNYHVLVKKIGELNQQIAELGGEGLAIEQAERDRQGMRNLEAKQYNAMSGPDVISSKDSRGSYQETNTYKGQVRESVVAQQRLDNARSQIASSMAEEDRMKIQRIERSKVQLLIENPNFIQGKAFISAESDAIATQYWPALKTTLAELAQNSNK
jgi:hypothetical protein